MDADEKIHNQDAFMSDKVRIIVATSAFGMGVDKSDVGLVIHYDISDSLENYVQEAGRAGRDPHLNAKCYVLYSDEDLDKHFILLNQTKLSISEIQQVWKAIKDFTKQRPHVSCSALEIARQAGWDDSVSDIETRVRTALSALEQSGYIERGNNIPHVYATGITVKNMDEARLRLTESPLFSEDEMQNAIRIIKAIIGLVQENKAETAMEALKNMNKAFSKVLRDGEWKHLASEEIVPGDVVRLEAGDIVPADMRLVSTASLKIEEAALTGESVPAEKNAEKTVAQDAPLGDRADMAYSSGVVAYGRGVGVVTATGMDTEVCKIATMLTDGSQQTSPLQKQLGKTAKLLSILILAIAAVLFVVQAARGEDIMESFMTAVAIAVAAIPEGLPAVVTIVLAIGVQRMSKRNAIVKNLPSVETLGCCEVYCGLSSINPPAEGLDVDCRSPN
jgi:hypothetical protein